jgi:hypothetical protein
MAQHPLDFYFESDPVGTFCGRAYPQVPGRVEYSPYRGPGHALFGCALVRDGKVRCWFKRRNRKIEFDVVGKEFVSGSPISRSHWFVEISWIGANEESAAGAGRRRHPFRPGRSFR